jgi:uncharacterized membrane protein
MKPQPWLIVVLVGAALGLVLAGLSTYDFVQHLDRQVHSIHCSFIPGLGKEAGESGCQVAMMSPYSSVFRTSVWGGIPISLPAMAVFAFVLLYAIDLSLTRRQFDRRAAAFLAAACGLPMVTSIVMLIISLTKLGTTCKLCVGIYLASTACFVGAVAVWRKSTKHAPAAARGPNPRVTKPKKADLPDEPAFTGGSNALPREPVEEPRAVKVSPRGLVPGVASEPAGNGFLAAAFGTGLAFVGIPVLLYLALAPDHGKFIGTCDALAKPEDPYGVMVRMTTAKPSGNPAKVIEVLDPLCPACRAFEQRLTASGFAGELDRQAVLFPLDNTCNWMVTEATHPGACVVSEAVLCAAAKDPNSAPAVIEWAFANQEKIRDATKADPEAAARMSRERFPELATCIGSADAKSRLNKSLRWSVANNLRVLTPQIFVDGVKLCDEDVDLGLEFTLNKMLERHAAGTLAPVRAEAPAPKPAEPVAKPEDKADKKPEDKKPTDKKPEDKKPTDKKSEDKPEDKKPADKKPEDKPEDKKAADKKPEDKKPTDKKPADKRPIDSKPDEPVKIPDRRPADEDKPAEPKPAEPKPAEPKPAEPKPAEPKPAAPGDTP